ncbi:hypothetical protein B0O80DRAFT_233947 [Mortierella sp. GBAus27b]|nr:hypothetical protein B0O80DRAFT_233947 [Mortierella sp. GBAus27b]
MSSPIKNKRSWRRDIETLTSKDYFESCLRPQDFSYQGFLLWSKKHLVGRARVRQEWSDARKHFHRSQYQSLRNAAVRLDKAWSSGVDLDFETNFFNGLRAKHRLISGRQTVHEAADDVIIKRQRIELEEEGRSLDERPQSSKDHPSFVDDLSTEEDASDFEQEVGLMSGQTTPPPQVQGHFDTVPLVKDGIVPSCYEPDRCI